MLYSIEKKSIKIMPQPAPLNAIRVFAVAARLQSFKQAAAELFVTPGAVSRQIQALEQHLGVQLFERKFREVSLSQMGVLYLAQIGPALAAIDQATQRLQDLTQRAVVRVESTPTFAMYWLIPRLAQFQARHPEIDLRLTTSQGTVDRGKDVDLFIRRDPAQFGGLRGESFMTEWSSLVCSPCLLQQKKLGTPQAIVRSQLICMRSRLDLWPKWFEKNAIDASQVTRRIELDNTILAIQAAIEGLGVALIPRLFLDNLLDGGALVCLPKTQPFATGDYHLLAARSRRSTESVIFSDWLRDTANR